MTNLNNTWKFLLMTSSLHSAKNLNTGLKTSFTRCTIENTMLKKPQVSENQLKKFLIGQTLTFLITLSQCFRSETSFTTSKTRTWILKWTTLATPKSSSHELGLSVSVTTRMNLTTLSSSLKPPGTPNPAPVFKNNTSSSQQVQA